MKVVVVGHYDAWSTPPADMALPVVQETKTGLQRNRNNAASVRRGDLNNWTTVCVGMQSSLYYRSQQIVGPLCVCVTVYR
jgi:hypothetical protein